MYIYEALSPASSRMCQSAFRTSRWLTLEHKACFFYLDLHAPPWSVDDEGHQAARDDTGTRQGDDPAAVDPADHAPVQGTPVAVAQTDADNGAGDALGGRDGQLCGRK